MSSLPDQPNYYLLLELDPTVRDWPSVEAHIKKQRNEWTRRGTTDMKYKRKAELTWEAEKVLRENASRVRQAELAKRHYQELLDPIIALHSHNAQCTHADYQKIVAKFSGKLTEAEVRDRFSATGVTVITESLRAPTPHRIPPALENPIEKNLEILNQRDLYTFLSTGNEWGPGLPRASLSRKDSAAILRARSETLAKFLRQTRHTSNEATAREALCAICVNQIFKNEHTKQGYDNYLAIAPMKKLTHLYDALENGSSISRHRLNVLLREAGKLGVDQQTARIYLDELAHQRKWEMPSELDDEPSSGQAQSASTTWPQAKTKPEPERTPAASAGAGTSTPVSSRKRASGTFWRRLRSVSLTLVGVMVLFAAGILGWQLLVDDGRQTYAAQAGDWRGGFPVQGNGTYGRPWTAVHEDGPYRQASVVVSVSGTPGNGGQLLLTGLDDEYDVKPIITVGVNREIVYEGVSPFQNAIGRDRGAENPWKEVKFDIRDGVLLEGNNIVWVTVNDPSESPVARFVYLSDAAIEMTVASENRSKDVLVSDSNLYYVSLRSTSDPEAK